MVLWDKKIIHFSWMCIIPSKLGYDMIKRFSIFFSRGFNSIHVLSSIAPFQDSSFHQVMENSSQ